MRVIGIDPGLSTTGYGILENSRDRIGVIDYGVIRTDRNQPIESRLMSLFAEMQELLAINDPCSMAIERILFQVNTKTAISVGHASGAILVAAAQVGIEVTFYSPNEVKQAVSGYGSADKSQVTAMISRILRLSESPRPADAADALAIAYTHLQAGRLNSRLIGAGP